MLNSNADSHHHDNKDNTTNTMKKGNNINQHDNTLYQGSRQP